MKKVQTSHSNSHTLFTKKHIVGIHNLWEDKNAAQISHELGITSQQVSYLASQMRKAGIQLPKKKVTGALRHLIVETGHEQKWLKA